MKTKKLQVSISEELDNLISEKSEKIGISKSSYCAFIIGDYIEKQNKIEKQLLGEGGLIEMLKINSVNNPVKK